MQINAKTKYINEPAVLTFGQYGDGSLAITLESTMGEPLARATVCVAEYGFTPPDGFVVIKNYSEGQGMLDCLIAEKVIKAPLKSLIAGPFDTQFPVCEITDETLLAALEAGMIPAVA